MEETNNAPLRPLESHIRERVQQALNQVRNIDTVAKRWRIHRNTLASAIAGFNVSEGTRAIIERGLALEEAEKR